MNLTDKRLRELDTPSLTRDVRAALRCGVTADLIHAGQYEAARDALGEFWRGVGARPDMEGLSEQTAAEVLLQCGALSGWLGANEQTAGAQEAAKDLISESAARFEELGRTARAALARSDLALCYWREGAYDEARVLLERAADELTDADAEQRLRVILRRVTVEYTAGRLNEALCILTQYAPLLDESGNHILLGSFHSSLGLVLTPLGAEEQRRDYLDRAIIEYTAAIFHYEQAKHERYCARNLNNLAFLLYKLGRYGEAHEHLDRAQLIFTKLRDPGSVAQVDETRARVLIAEKKYREASKVIGHAIQTLENGGASGLLADALTVQGVAWARLGTYENSQNILRRAVSLAEQSGALYNAGLAALTLIEEHGARRLPEDELYSLYLRADGLLRGAQAHEDADRLRACARLIIKRLAGLRLSDKSFSLHGALHDVEARYIAQALDEAGGSITRAAKLLGLRHQSLSIILNTRHRKLLSKRTRPRTRRKSIIRKEDHI